MAGDASSSQFRDEFWVLLGQRLTAAGFRPAQRANYCYLRLGVANTRLVLTAPTGDGGVECKLSLAGARRASTLSPDEIFEQLHDDRKAIETEARCEPLEWGSGRSGTRVYLRRPANLADRGTWEETMEWLIGRAERFTTVFRPRLLAITDAAAGDDSTGRVRRSSVEHGAAPPQTRAQSKPGTVMARELPLPRGRSGPDGTDADELALDTRLRALADRFGLVLKRPASYYGQAWSLEAEPEPSGEHLHRYAYALWWLPRQQPRLDDMVAWVMLNPSTGDTDNKPRPTLGYCRNRTRLDWHYGGLLILNLFAYRATQPQALYKLPRDVCVGAWNDDLLSDLVPRCGLAVGAWGHHGAQHGRSGEVKALLPELRGIINRDGQPTGAGGEPSHPRWLPRTPQLYRLNFIGSGS